MLNELNAYPHCRAFPFFGASSFAGMNMEGQDRMLAPQGRADTIRIACEPFMSVPAKRSSVVSTANKALKTKIGLFLLAVGISTRAAAARGEFLFTTMRDESSPSSEQIYFAASEDGKRWESLNGGKPVLQSDVGEKGVRDSFLLRSHDGKKFWLIGTDLWINRNGDWNRATHAGSKSIVIWESADLVHWSQAWLAQVAPDDAGCTWAPEAIYDEEASDYLVYWASLTKRDNYAKQRIWAAHSKDFHTFSEPFVFLEKPTHVIDINIVRGGDTYYRFTKEKTAAMATSKKLTGPWHEVEAFAAGKGADPEGPICFQLKPASGDQTAEWCLLLDNLHGRDRGYEPYVSHDPGSGQFAPATDFKFPYRFRHGSVLSITTEELKRIRAAYPAPSTQESVKQEKK
jgi:hypothetical protein